MMDWRVDPKTSTWPRRHVQAFADIRPLLAPPADGRPLEVADVGPGLAVKHLGRLAARTTLLQDIFRRIETGVRRVPMPDAFYENYETHELVEALVGLPFRLTLIDINPRVVRVVRGSLEEGHAVEGVIADLGVENPPALTPLRGTFDLVVAFAVVARIPRPLADTALGNIRSLVKPGGLLVGSAAFAAPDCVRIADGQNVFRKVAPAGSAAGA